MGLELSSLGIHADCSPVVDLPIDGAHDIIGDRAFAKTPTDIGALTNMALQGLRDAGVAGVIKHIPGHGRARADSHEELPVVEAGENVLAEDFEAFQAVKHAPMAMTAHILYPAFDPKEPATTSKTVISDVIRQRIGFDGLLMSDDLGMKALGGPLAERARRSLAAGCDVGLHCAGFEKDPRVILDEMIEVASGCDELDGIQLARAKAAEDSSTHAISVDAANLEERFSQLMAEGGARV